MMTSKQLSFQCALLDKAYGSYKNGLVAHAFLKTHNHLTSDDLSQETFMKTWKYLIKGGEIITMKAFLYHVMNNLIIDEYRKSSATSLDLLLEKGFEPSTDGADDIFNLLDAKATVLLIDRLPFRYQKTMNMRFIQDMSLSQISLMTNQSKNAVAVQIYRGLLKMRLLDSGAYS